MQVVVILPLGAFIISLIAILFVYRAFITQPWRLKRTLIIGMFFWIPWSGFTVLMRYTDNSKLALLYLRISFLSLQILSFSLYRFHYLLVHNFTDIQTSYFVMAALTGFNIGMSFNEKFLYISQINGVYSDTFHPILLITNLSVNTLAAYWIIKALRNLNLFAGFYGENKTIKVIQITIAIVLSSMMSIFFIVWIILGKTGERPDSSLFIALSWFIISFLAYVYGLDPISKMVTPQRIWNFIIINESGIPIFDISFSKDIKDYYAVAISGLIFATNAIMKEQLKQKGSLKSVTLKDRAIMINSINNLMFCLIIDHLSTQFEIILQEISNRILSSENFKQMKSFTHPKTNMGFVKSILIDLIQKR